MTGVPGWFAVLPRSAVSVTGFPKSTGPDPAWVTSVGCLGVTLKHSPPVASVAFGMPCVAELAAGVVEDRRGQGLRGAGVADEDVEAVASEVGLCQVEPTLEELRDLEGVANTVGLVRRQPWGRDRRVDREGAGVRGGAGRVAWSRRLAVDAVGDGGRTERAGGVAVPTVDVDRADASPLGEGGDDQQIAVHVVAGPWRVAAGW